MTSRLSEETRNLIVHMARAGCHVPRIAEVAGVSRGTVYGVLAEHGIKAARKPMERRARE